MSWKSESEIEAILEGFPRLDSLELMFNLHLYAQQAIYPSDYLASPSWEELVTLTEAGEDYLALDATVKQNLPSGDVYFAVFGKLYHHDLLIDLEKSDLEGILRLMNQELFETRVRWPFRFGRLLYDRFNDFVLHGREIRYLEPSQVADLLKGTPQGVYQVGRLLSGPLGLLMSQEARYFPPVMGAPLWHCSDTGCRIVHNAYFQVPQIPVTKAYNRLDEAASSRLGPASEWYQVLRKLHRTGQWPRTRPYHDLPALLGDAIVNDERTILLTAALESPQRTWLREVLGSPPRRNRVAQGTAEHVASGLSEAEQLQLLLMLRDNDLVTLVDNCVLSGDIRIPSNELRIPQARIRKLNPWDSYTELSSFGLRAQRRHPLITLMSTIWKTYESQGLLDELSWKLGKPGDILTQNVLMDYIQVRGPAEAVRHLILPSRPVALCVAKDAGVTISPDEEREQLVSRLLWKFGFDPSRYGDDYPRLRTRLAQFKDVLLRTGVIRTEDDREEIRSNGVNLFVSIEQFLEELVSYNVWLLASDHFINTRNRFRYDSRSAVAAVGETLGNQVTVNGKDFAWDDKGGNTLGSLLVYLDCGRQWMRSLPDRERTEVERHRDDFPTFVDDAELVFPFTHTQLWADCDASELANFIEGFDEVASRLLKSNLAAVRNGLDHKRSASSFPSTDQMLTCVNYLQDALDFADVNRYIPKTFWRISRNIDRFQREESVLCDYRNREVLIKQPTAVSNRGSLSFKEAVLIAPGNLLGKPNSELIFRVLYESRYSEYWDGYPRRRKTSAPNTEESETHTEELLGDATEDV